jgi:hypothetical protein
MIIKQCEKYAAYYINFKIRQIKNILPISKAISWLMLLHVKKGSKDTIGLEVLLYSH